MSDKSPRQAVIVLLLAAAVIVPAMFWQRVWFGSSLSDEEIRQRLAQPEKAREVQHACEQISRRMQRDPGSARQFYDLLVPLARHADEHIRSVAAWCMGEDGSRYPPFQKALVESAADASPQVRYNAALGLARLGDPAAKPVLREMLTSFTVSARWEGNSDKGTVVDILGRLVPVRPSEQLALVATGEDEPKAVRAPLGGRVGSVTVRGGDTITRGEPLCTIDPDFQQVYEALRALVLVGGPDDLESVQPYFDPHSRFSQSERARLEAQARLTADAIEKRQEKKATTSRAHSQTDGWLGLDRGEAPVAAFTGAPQGYAPATPESK